MTNATVWNRRANSTSVVLHVAKERFPNEALCGKVLSETRVTRTRGAHKCGNCKKSLEAVK